MRKLIGSLRWTTLGDPTTSLDLAREIAARMNALGGRLVAFGGFELGFAFEPDAGAVVGEALREVVGDHRELARAGMAESEIALWAPVGGPSAVELAWGEGVVLAAALARAARTGEVLVDAEVSAVKDRSISLVGPERTLTFGSVTRLVHLVGAAIEDPPTDIIAGPLPEEPPQRESVTIVPRHPNAPQDLLELARTAVARADAPTLDAAVASLTLSDAHTEVVQRLAGILAAGGGAKEDGLRLLRRMAVGSKSDDQRARSLLAYAIGVAAAGRLEEALLESLSALAIARRQLDAGGERACARFLAQLCQQAGHDDAASAWEHVVLRLSP